MMRRHLPGLVFCCAAALAACTHEPASLEWDGTGEANVRAKTLESVDLKDVALDAQGRTALVPLELPSDVQSVLVEVSCDRDALCVVDRLEGPGGRKLVMASASGDPDGFAGPAASPNRSVAIAHGSSALLVPNNPKVKLTSGSWHVGVVTRGGKAKSVDIKVWIKRGARTAKAGILDLDVYVTGLHGWSADSARNDPFVRGLLAEVERCLETASIRVGDVTWNDADPRFEVVTSSTSDAAPEKLLARSSKRGLSLFLVRELWLDAGRVGGFSGGIPGPLSVGTSSSGVIVALPVRENGPTASAAILGASTAHEIGHYLGLSHTTEIGSEEEDQLDDTGPGDDGADNVMFPSPSRSERSRSFSPQQGDVLRRHPLVR